MATLELALAVEIDEIHAELLEEVDAEVESSGDIPFDSAETLLQQKLSEASSEQIEQLIYDLRQQFKNGGPQ